MALCGLAACGSLAPPMTRPALPVPAQYPGSATTDAHESAGNTAAASMSWQQYFGDPELQSLIEQALRNNRDLRVAVLRVQQVQASYRIQRAQRLPSIEAQAGLSRTGLPAAVSPTGRAMVQDQLQVGLGSLNWEIDFWGRLRNLQDAALDQYLATDAARRALQLSLIAQVADAYLALRALDERSELARRTVASREQSLRIFTRRVEVGAISRLNLTQVQTLLTQAQALLSQLDQEREQQAHALALLVGSPWTPPPGGPRWDAPGLVPELRPGLPSELLEQRPDIVAAEYQLAAANADIGAARAAYFPRIALTGLAGSVSGELDGLFAPNGRLWLVAPSVSLPVFDGGRRRANLDASKAAYGIALAQYERTIQSAFREVSDALTARQRLHEQVLIAETALRVQSERARLSALRYDNGAAPFLEVLDAQRDLFDTEQTLVQLRRAELASGIALYAALGGGFVANPAFDVNTTQTGKHEQ